MGNKSKVLVIGLDGATWKIINPLTKKGKLPFFEQLKKKGTSGVLLSTIPTLTVPSWTSFQTGLNPGNHGLFDFLDYSKSRTDPDVFLSSSIKDKKIWEELEEYKMKSLVINMPASYPPRKINGIMISSFLTPVGEAYVKPKKYEKLLSDIDYEIDILAEERYGILPGKKLTRDERIRILNKLIDISKKRVKAFEILSKKEHFAFNFILFKGTDLAQHLFWNYKELEKYYVALDFMLNDMIKKFTSDKNYSYTVIVISDHGFHKSPEMQFSPSLLIGKLFQKENINISRDGRWVLLSKINQYFKKIGMNPTNFKIIYKLRNRLLTSGKNSEYKTLGYLVTPNGIYFNKDMFDDKKIVRIISGLKKARFKSKKVFSIVGKPKDIYFGDRITYAPDIVWLPSEDFEVNTSAYATNIFEKRMYTLKAQHTGDRKGIFIAIGDNFPRAKKLKLSIEDIYPIVFMSLGLPVRSNIDGKVPNLLNRENKASYKKRVMGKVDNAITKLDRI